MTRYDYLVSMGDNKIKELVRYGLLDALWLGRMEIYKWHIENGRKREDTAEHYHLSKWQVSYIVKLMS